jgi:hypothetical protein
MSFTITLGWWTIPTIITICMLLWAMWCSRDDSYGIGVLLFGGAAAFVSCIAWMVAGFMK